MYFVVYLIEPKRYAVIPCYWIYDEDGELYNKFMNTGLNSSQKYLCYWSSANNSVEYSGAPDDFEPNFNAARSTLFPVDEGTFPCRIAYFRGELNVFIWHILYSILTLEFVFVFLNSKTRHGS